jgi:GT2 family glycosyltransferase
MNVIIPAYRKPDQLERCLAALAAQTHPCSPVVIDNDTENRGFTAACNEGLRLAIDRGEEFAVLLNQDCYLQPNAIEKAIEFMRDHPRCAILGAKQLAYGHEDVIVHGGCTQAFPAGAHLTGRVSKDECNMPAKMPWINGACMVIRLDALKEFGLLDEGMFLVGSDSDICFTARLRGWEVWYAPTVVCSHECGESSTPTSEKVIEIMRKDMTYWASKWITGQAYHRLAKNYV